MCRESFFRWKLEKVVVEESEEQSSSSGNEDLHQVKDNAELWSRNNELCGELDKLEHELQSTKVRVKDLWQTNCDQVREADEMIAAKDEEIAALQIQWLLLGSAGTVPGVLGVTETSTSVALIQCRVAEYVGCGVSAPAVFGGARVSQGGLRD